ncbi:hypothetical protein B0T26DRAFT_670267 [Lasiosphaeria miniovina]|uniref:Uncharacterized protein n=1 Tax=Lasiosphaeria miniovina TaxID=1954250 RepID=A0AA40BGQ1_9PEZI|nr:uncharacterized protein B0T26DRAFT_670267 [Lasiosphaeria miniovina]KAK0733920.1 hypothetical protein B0T26DRAFT_670267 [Lasiosphaeria miniovina]
MDATLPKAAFLGSRESLKPARVRQHHSDGDIELDGWPSPCGGTQSTDDLSETIEGLSFHSSTSTTRNSVAALATILPIHGNTRLREALLSIPTPSGDGSSQISDRELVDKFNNTRFALRYYSGHPGSGGGGDNYGIVMLEGRRSGTRDSGSSSGRPTPPLRAKRQQGAWWRRFVDMSPEAREGDIRLLFLLFVSGLLILILYYESTPLDTASACFSRRWGCLSAPFGNTTFSGRSPWTSTFTPYSRSRLSSRGMLFAPATTAFSGLARSIAGRQGMSGAIALAAVLSKFLPIMLSTVPFRNITT